jgi:hypothetical protein
MAPDELPLIINLQERIARDFTDELIEEMMREFRGGKSLANIAAEFLGEHQIGVATNAIRNVLMETIPESEYRGLTY